MFSEEMYSFVLICVPCFRIKHITKDKSEMCSIRAFQYGKSEAIQKVSFPHQYNSLAY
jgi:hypothetical protein